MTAAAQSRQGTRGEAIDGVTPDLVAEPTTGEGCAAALAAAASSRLSTVIRGGGTKSAWGRPVDAVDFVLSMRSLSDLLVHRDGDLTVTVGAGVTLARLNTTLAARGQWLPIDSAFVGSTVGGVLATNDSGPLRQRFGTPRDLLIGITLALTDGRLVKSGGTVVKNVAGYDLGKLVTGSYGALAAIVDATFKLLPLPHASATLRAVYTTPEPLAADAAASAAGQLEPHAAGAICLQSRVRVDAARSGARAAARRYDGVARGARDAGLGRAGRAGVGSLECARGTRRDRGGALQLAARAARRRARHGARSARRLRRDAHRPRGDRQRTPASDRCGERHHRGH
jgi:glycolate oxidase FAD binding subunit